LNSGKDADPRAGRSPAATHVTDPSLRGTVKELARVDGVFVIADDGMVSRRARFSMHLGQREPGKASNASDVARESDVEVKSRHFAPSNSTPRQNSTFRFKSGQNVARAWMSIND
jgi:hypothetical protein